VEDAGLSRLQETVRRTMQALKNLKREHWELRSEYQHALAERERDLEHTRAQLLALHDELESARAQSIHPIQAGTGDLEGLQRTLDQTVQALEVEQKENRELRRERQTLKRKLEELHQSLEEIQLRP
jgi:chromosome segregation ATPase